MALVVGLHVVLTFLTVAPRGPATAAAAPLLHRWSTPLFVQNWNLFAPDPVSVDRGLLVRSRADPADPGGEFTDVTSPELDGIEGHLIPARTTRLSTGAIRQLLTDVRVLQRYAGARPDGSCPPRRTAAEIAAAARDPAALLARVDRLADDPCVPAAVRADYRVNRGYAVRLALSGLPADRAAAATEVQVRVATYRYPRFADRSRRTGGTVTALTFPWWPVGAGR